MIAFAVERNQLLQPGHIQGRDPVNRAVQILQPEILTDIQGGQSIIFAIEGFQCGKDLDSLQRGQVLICYIDGTDISQLLGGQHAVCAVSADMRGVF